MEKRPWHIEIKDVYGPERVVKKSRVMQMSFVPTYEFPKNVVVAEGPWTRKEEK